MSTPTGESGMKSAVRNILGLSFMLFAGAYCLAAQADEATQAADYVFKNGKVYTVDARQPWAQAVAVKGNKISYVGSSVGSTQWVGPETQVIDLKGRMLLPGFIDGHNHFVAGAATKRGVNLAGSKDTEEMLRRIGAYVQANPRKSAYMGFNWEFPMLGDTGGTRAELDAISSDKPMIFFNEDTHHAWFNTRAMELAGIDKDTPDPVPGGSYFRRGPDGTPSGIAIEPDSWQKMAIATGLFGGREMLQDIVDEVFPILPRLGITAYHDMGIWAPDMPSGYLGFELLIDMEKAGRLPCRVVGTYATRDGKSSPETHIQSLKEWSSRYRSELVQVTGLKVWADGVFLAHTGVQIEPYADQPETRGESDWTAEVLARWIETAYRAGFDVNIHTDGDLAVRRSLDAVEQVEKKLGPLGPLTTLHHVPTIHPDDLPRIAALGVGANMTPVWLIDYKGQYAEAKRILGKEKVAKEYGLLVPLLESGVNVSFGSDIPGTDVEEAAPLLQIQVAVTGRMPGSTSTEIPPASRLPSLEQMIKGYTLAGARQMRMEDRIGSIEVGKLADLVVLERNLFDLPADQIAATKVLLTMMNGKVRHMDAEL